MLAAVSPSSEFARWWANGLQNNLRAYCNCATGGIVRSIAADDPATAETFAMHLLDRANWLRRTQDESSERERVTLTAEPRACGERLGSPRVHSRTPYRKRKNVRRLRCDPYFIYHRVRRENHLIEVMDFWHSLGWNRTSDILCFPPHLRFLVFSKVKATRVGASKPGRRASFN